MACGRGGPVHGLGEILAVSLMTSTTVTGTTVEVVGLVEVDEVRVDLLGPAARRLEDLNGEHREGDRERDIGRRTSFADERRAVSG